MPADSDIFMLREKEKQHNLEVKFFEEINHWVFKIDTWNWKEREKNKTLKVHEKLTRNQKLIAGMKAGLKPDISDDDMGDDDDVLIFFGLTWFHWYDFETLWFDLKRMLATLATTRWKRTGHGRLRWQEIVALKKRA